jgi:SAM-dependent methyltransferase
MLSKIAYGPIGRGKLGTFIKTTFIGTIIKRKLESKVVEKIIQKKVELANHATLALDLGCGSNKRNPFNASYTYGIDVRQDLSNNIYCADLSIERLPFQDNTFDYCTAFDFIEHIPRLIRVDGKNRSSFIELINEIYRVLKPNGYFLHSTPGYPSKEVFQDPTHTNIITKDTFPLYFCSPYLGAFKLGYGYTGNFRNIAQKIDRGIWIVGLMQAVK